MKKNSIFWGVAFICAAVLILIDGIGTGLGVLNDIPIVKIILGVACLCWVINELYRRRLSHIFFPLSFLFMLFEGEIAKLCGLETDNILSNWLLLLCALLLTIGTGIICSTPYKVFNGKKRNKIMGKVTRYIDCSDFTYQEVEINMGSCEVFFENIENYQGNGTLHIENNMASMKIHVPATWHIVETISNDMGSVKLASTGDPAGKKVSITGENAMGNVTIELV